MLAVSQNLTQIGGILTDVLATALVQVGVGDLMEFQCQRHRDIIQVHNISLGIHQLDVENRDVHGCAERNRVVQQSRELLLGNGVLAHRDRDLGYRANLSVVRCSVLDRVLFVDLQEVLCIPRKIDKRSRSHRVISRSVGTRCGLGIHTEPQVISQSPILRTVGPPQGCIAERDGKVGIQGQCKFTGCAPHRHRNGQTGQCIRECGRQCGLNGGCILVAIGNCDGIIRSSRIDDEAIVPLRRRDCKGRVRNFGTHNFETAHIANRCGYAILEVGRASGELVVHAIGDRRASPLAIHAHILAKTAINAQETALDIRILVDTGLGHVVLADHPFTLRLEFFPT